MENPKVIKKGDQVITSYVDEKTGKFTSYEVGIKLEVSDFSGQWFPAKIVEVDKGEKEVLVHFENWSARFDEWIKMDSNRLRPTPSTNIVKTNFKIGENVEALWNTDGQRYPGVIQNILPNDYYQVLFDDGIKLKKKYNQIFKLKPTTRKSGGASAKKSSLDSPGGSSSSASSDLAPIPSADQVQAKPSTTQQPPPPPPLTPKPVLKAGTESPKIPPSELVPVKPKSWSRRKKVVPPLPSPTPPLSTPAVSPVATPNTNISSPVSPTAGSDDAMSSKRKRTVQDYSALLRIRRRYAYGNQKEGEVEKIKRPRRGRGSPHSQPPELYPESSSMSTSQVPTTSHHSPVIAIESAIPNEVQVEDPVSENIVPILEDLDTLKTEPAIDPATDPLLVDVPSVSSLPINQLPSEKLPLPHEIPMVVPLPISKPKPKPKRKTFRPFGSVRRVKKKQRIKYVTVDDEEFEAAGGARKLNKPSLSGPATPGRGNSEASDSEFLAPSTPTSVKESGSGENFEPTVTAADSPVDSSGLRIIKRRRRRTYARLQLVASEGIGVDSTPPSVDLATPLASDEPLSKRKRTIHDYSMLLKTRPKFFFDIDAEQERPGMQPTRRTRQTDSTSSASSLTSPLSPSSSDLSPLHQPTTVEGDMDMKHGIENVLPVVDLPRTEPLSSVSSSESGPTSIATHRPVRRSSSQFARKSQVSQDEIQLVRTRGTEAGLKGSSATVLLENIDSRLDSHGGRSTGIISHESGNRRSTFRGNARRLPSKGIDRTKTQHQQESKPIDLEYNEYDDEELLDIGYAGTAPSTSTQKQAISPTPAQASTAGKSVVKRKQRLIGNRWWKRRRSVQNSESRTDDLDYIPPTSPPSLTVPPSRTRKIVQKAKRRAGDLLSGLTLNRIRTIRNNLYKQGFRKRILAEPAAKDVSVDIISCICGSNDEHGLMVQCEFCQCWQHGQCFEIETVTDMPKNYVCGACLYPENVRSRKPFDFQYDFYKVGKLPRFQFGPMVQPKLSKMLQESNILIQRLYQVRSIIQTSRVHMNIMEAKPDHPKLYQWDKPHQTIRESQQERKFNKIYRPLLRRLLYFNRDDPTYVSRLRSKVEAVVNKRNAEERKKAEKRLNDKFPSILPTSKPGSNPALQKRLVPAPIFKTPAVPPLLASHKEAKRLETEALRIRKELETLNRNKMVLQPIDVGKIKTELKSDTVLPKVEDVENNGILMLMNEMLNKVESEVDFVPEEVKVQVPLSPPPVSAPLLKSKETTSLVVDLGEEPPPEFPDDLPDIEINSSLNILPEIKSEPTELVGPHIGSVTNENEHSIIVGQLEESSQKIEQDFSAVDLMNMDPSDPKFSTIAADLVKSCCEEPESLIKTLEDLANVSQSSTTVVETETVDGAGGTVEPEVDGTDTDLFNFLDDALMEETLNASTVTNTLPVSSVSTALPEFVIPPPPPPVHVPSTSSFMSPPRLTRLTPELCRGNLILTILDQQRIIDQHLDEIEARVVEMEKLRGIEDSSNRAVAFQRIIALQAKVKRMMREFELVKEIGRKAERGLREVIQEEPDGFDECSGGSEHEEIPEKDNEETDSADEYPEEEELSEELEDL